jgi:GxxExxY protein
VSFSPISMDVEEYGRTVVDAAFKVHKALGPGLLESVYHQCLRHELALRRVPLEYKKSIPIVYEGLRLESGLEIDLLVASSVVVEVKAVEELHTLFEAQLLTYLKLTGLRLGLLINFNVPLLKDGIKRLVR